MGPTSTRTSSADRVRVGAGRAFGFCAVAAIAVVVFAIGVSAIDAPEAFGDSAPEVTDSSCLLCHSDRQEMKSFSHRERVEDLAGCATCHGKGTDHVMSRGDPSLIKNPKKLPGDQADRSCVLCHSDFKAPDHFTPSAGKERCVDCHVIHAPPAVAALVPEPTPGKPALDLGTAGDPADYETKSFPIYGDTPMPDGYGEEAIGGLWTGDFRLGYRYVGVDGNGRTFDQYYGFDQGFRLFDMDIEGLISGDEETRIGLTATGIDEPVENYQFDVKHGDDWALDVTGMRTNFVYFATADYGAQSTKRQMLNAELTFSPDSPFRITLGYDYWARDGRQQNGLFFSGAIRSVEVPIDETSHNLYARVEWDYGIGSLSFTQAYRWEDLDLGIRGMGDPVNDIDLDQKTELTAPVTTILATARVDPAVTLDAKFVWSPIDVDTDVDSTTSASGFEEELFGDVGGTRDYIRGELGVTWFASPEWVVRARLEGFQIQDENDGEFAELPSGDMDTADRELDHRRWRGFAEVGYDADSWGTYRVGYEYMYEEFDTERDGDVDLHDSNYHGPYIGINLEAADWLDFDFDYRFIRVNDPWTAIGTADSTNIRARARIKASDEVVATGFFSEGYRTNPRFDTEVRAWSAGLDIVYQPSEDLSIQLGYDYQSYENETDVVRFIDFTPVPGVSEFNGRTSGVSLHVEHQATPALRLWGGALYYDTSGDYPSEIIDLSIGGEYDINRQVGVGTDLRWVSWEDELSPADNFDAYILEFWLRLRF